MPNHGNQNPRLSRQRQRNRESLQGWDTYAAHRARVTSLLTAASPRAQGRLCVLGAGNCNDLDLNVLRADFAEVHLVDLDSEALIAGLQRQGREPGDGLRVYGNTDLLDFQPGGISVATQGLTQSTQRGLERHAFDVVASTCVVSQLIEAACDFSPTDA